MEKITEFLLSSGYWIQDKLFAEEEKKIRFQNNERFVDVWDGKKGITVGIYNPETKRVKYHKKQDVESLEIILSKL